MLSNEDSSSGAYNGGSSKGATWWISCVRNTGIDFCGPFFYKPEARSRPPVKCYVCVFICYVAKQMNERYSFGVNQGSLHGSFLHGLKRFICTRRRPRQIWSDNATNFVGARYELLELRRLFLSSDHQRATLGFCLAEAYDWCFIPPRSPHFGGLWEEAVKIPAHFLNGTSIAWVDGNAWLTCSRSSTAFPDKFRNTAFCKP